MLTEQTKGLEANRHAVHNPDVRNKKTKPIIEVGNWFGVFCVIVVAVALVMFIGVRYSQRNQPPAIITAATEDTHLTTVYS